MDPFSSLGALTRRARRARRATVLLVALGSATALLGGAPSAGAEGIVPLEGGWVGTTSDQLRVTFHVVGDDVVDAYFGFRWGFCGAYNSTNRNRETIDPAGNWSYVDPSGPRIEGTFVGPEQAEGKVIAPSRETPGCPETVATFTAAPGVVPPPPKPRHYRVFAIVDEATGQRGVRPRHIVFGRHHIVRFYDLRWKSFGGSAARATGRALIEKGGRTYRPFARLVLSDPSVSQNHRYKVYEGTCYSLRGPLPRGVPRHLQIFRH